MTKIGLFYGSNTGNTEAVAHDIKSAFDEILPDTVQIHNIGASSAETVIQYDYLIFGVPTWNTGELQDDWDAFLPNFKTMDLKGKKLAIFG
ncbi:MAG: flavodoxin domain-containing protein, partial [Bacteroidota bacterium]